MSSSDSLFCFIFPKHQLSYLIWHRKPQYSEKGWFYLMYLLLPSGVGNFHIATHESLVISFNTYTKYWLPRLRLCFPLANLASTDYTYYTLSNRSLQRLLSLHQAILVNTENIFCKHRHPQTLGGISLQHKITCILKRRKGVRWGQVRREEKALLALSQPFSFSL